MIQKFKEVKLPHPTKFSLRYDKKLISKILKIEAVRVFSQNEFSGSTLRHTRALYGNVSSERDKQLASNV